MRAPNAPLSVSNGPKPAPNQPRTSPKPAAAFHVADRPMTLTPPLAGSFCFCLASADVEAATRINPLECRPSCASSGRVHQQLPGQSIPLPCGGSEAVAVFSTAQATRAMQAAATARPATRSTTERCAPMAEPCAEMENEGRRRDSGRSRARPLRALYVHSTAADRVTGATDDGGHARGASGAAGATGVAGASGAVGAGGVPPSSWFVHLGCFDDLALARSGISTRPALPHTARYAASPAAMDAPTCSAGCAHHAYFAVGAPELVGGPCLCGNLPTVYWRRDAEGVRGLRKNGLRSLT